MLNRTAITTAVKQSLRGLLIAAGRQMIAPGAPPRVVVFCYHSVHPTKAGVDATPEVFEQQLRWLKAHCEPVKFHEVWTIAFAPQRGARPAVAITFDDGYADNYEFAFPLLQQFAIPATFFLTAGLLEKDPVVLRRFQALLGTDGGGVRPLTWAAVQEMRRAGMEFGAHTYSHPNLGRLDRAAAEVELRRAKDILEDRLGERVTMMAYPFGMPKRHFTLETVEIVSEVGYDFAASITSRPVSPSHCRFAIPRFYARGDGLGAFQDKVLGAWDLVGLWHERGPAFLQNLSEAIG